MDSVLAGAATHAKDASSEDNSKTIMPEYGPKPAAPSIVYIKLELFLFNLLFVFRSPLIPDRPGGLAISLVE